jgi:predicted nucleic acid-binding protein
VKIKAILDTNVLISGVLWKGPPFEILKAWQEQRFRLAISLPILDVIELHSEIVKPVPFS